MRSTGLALAVLFATLAASPTASAQKVELAGKVTASRTVLAQRRIGEPRYIALSDLFYRDRSGILEILDLETMGVIQVTAKRSLLEKKFAGRRGGVPLGEIVSYRNGVVGLSLVEASANQSRHYWYAELDAQTGKLLRSVYLGTVGEGEILEVVGADAAGSAAWFAITERASSGRALVLRRLDLLTLETFDDQRVALPMRNAGREHGVQVHASADFSRFAIVEYVEDGVRMAPGRVYVVSPAVGGYCAVPAPPTTYGVAFSGDGRYVYLGSAQRGTISRVELAACKVDKQVAAPRYLHHLIVSHSGTKLFAFASSTSYAVYDLPDLRARHDGTHPSGVAGPMSQLYGEGIASLDGAYFVVPEADDRRRAPGPDRSYVIARLVE